MTSHPNTVHLLCDAQIIVDFIVHRIYYPSRDGSPSPSLFPQGTGRSPVSPRRGFLSRVTSKRQHYDQA
jgi:hypothetical protein